MNGPMDPDPACEAELQANPVATARRPAGQGVVLGGANLMSEPRDIDRDAKWRRLVIGGDIGASHAAWRCEECAEDPSFIRGLSDS
jgi:hypothetical protein